MTKIRMFLIAALAVIVALGVCGQPAQAQSVTVRNGTHASVISIGHWVPNASPDAAAVVNGPVMWDDGVQVPPCFAPNAPCTADPAGGLNVGYPLPFWPINGSGTGDTCNNVTLQACGQIDSFIETNTGSGKVSATITIKQGTTTIFTYSTGDIGTATAGEIVAVSVDGIQLDATATAGTAVITVVTKVGKAKSTGKATIVLTD
jgi:hypothetical protein